MGIVQLRGVVICSDPPRYLLRHCGARHNLSPAGVQGPVESEVRGSEIQHRTAREGIMAKNKARQARVDVERCCSR